MPLFKDLTNQRFGRLTAIYPTNKRQNRHTIWLCRCDCGNLAEVERGNLLVERTKSCGCLQKEQVRKRNTVHGDASRESQTRLHQIWSAMNKRCRNPNSSNYKYHGKRGIFVCREWASGYVVFRDWALSNGYADNLTIDRINNDGDYTLNNCQWITKSENTKKSHIERKLRNSACGAVTVAWI